MFKVVVYLHRMLKELIYTT